MIRRTPISAAVLAVASVLAAGVVTAVAAGQASGAYACLESAAYSGGNYTYTRCDVPDLDQIRRSDGSVLGLPNEGRMWCLPTSTMNWFAYIADHGLPHLQPGVADWESPDEEVYDQMTAELLGLGVRMNTNPVTGPPVFDALAGARGWLATNGVGQLFDVSSYWSSGFYAPTLSSIAQASVGGSLVSVAIGRYQDMRAEAAALGLPSSFIALLPKGLVSNGGHVVTLVHAVGTPTQAILGVHDSARGEPQDDLAPFRQGPFTRQEYPAEVVPVLVDGQARAEIQLPTFRDSPHNYVYGYQAIRPKFALSTTGSTFVVMTPVAALLGGGGIFEPAPVRMVDAASAAKILDVAIHPEQTRHPYIAEGENTIWQLDALTGDSTRFATIGNPRDLVFGGREQDLFVLLPNHIVSLGLKATEKHRVLLREPVDAIAFDPVRDRVIGVSRAENRLLFFTSRLEPAGTVALPELGCDGRLSIDVDPRTGEILVHCDGSPIVHGVGEAGSRVLVLQGAEEPTGLSVDDAGSIHVVEDGVLAEFDEHGRRADESVFAGMPAGRTVALSRSFTNFDPATMTGRGYRNLLPDEPDPPLELPPGR